MLIGIDTLGLLDDLVIDYRRMELQVRTRHNNWENSKCPINEPWFAVRRAWRRHPPIAMAKVRIQEVRKLTVPD